MRTLLLLSLSALLLVGCRSHRDVSETVHTVDLTQLVRSGSIEVRPLLPDSLRPLVSVDPVSFQSDNVHGSFVPSRPSILDGFRITYHDTVTSVQVIDKSNNIVSRAEPDSVCSLQKFLCFVDYRLVIVIILIIGFLFLHRVRRRPQ